MAKRIALVLSDEALEIIEKTAPERERGAWVSRVIEAHHNARIVDGVGTIERLSAEIVRLRDEVQHWIGAWNK